jgi:hypothetical protein
MLGRRKSTTRLGHEMAQMRREFDAIYANLRRERPAETSGMTSLARLNPWQGQSQRSMTGDAFTDAWKSASRGASDISHHVDDVLDGAVRLARQRPVPAGIALLLIGVVVGLALRKAD